MTTTELLKTRSKMAQKMRAFFDGQGFIEVETPILVSNPGLEPHLKYFETTFAADMGDNTLGHNKFYLPTSPEYSLKKVLSKLEHPAKIYELARAFRNGEISKTHQPEFSMLEFYCTQFSLEELSNVCFELFSELASLGSSSSDWNLRQDFDLETLFIKHANTDFPSLRKTSSNFSEDFHLLFLNKIEPELRSLPGQIYLWNYPIEEAMLAKACLDDPYKAHRFEIFFNGAELGNAFDELLEETTLMNRCKTHYQQRIALYNQSPEIDLDFIKSCSELKHMEVSGIAIGWDRLLMKILKIDTLRETLSLPH